MPTYAGQFQINSNTKLKEFPSLQELPRIFVNVTKAIGMFVDIWLGKDVDPTSLYSPKPSTTPTPLTMADNIAANSVTSSQSRLFTQSVRGHPTTSQQQPSTVGTLKATKSQADTRRGMNESFSYCLIHPM